jgi:pilus assembly protein CpaD
MVVILKWMPRRAAWRAGTLGLALMVSACTSTVENWQEVKPQRQPEVQSVDHHHAVQFAGRSTRLSTYEEQQLSRFLASIGAARDNQFIISPRISAGDSGAGAQTARARAHTIARHLRARGLDPEIVLSPTETAGGLSRVDVVVRQYLVTLPPCPDWTARPGWNFGNQPSSNWGCATATNLGLMVADPADLVRGAGSQPASAEPLVLSIDRYRRDEIKELQVETTTEVFQDSGGD